MMSSPKSAAQITLMEKGIYLDPDALLWAGSIPELYCSFNIYRLEDMFGRDGYVRLYVDITPEQELPPHIQQQTDLDLTYTIAEYEMLEREFMLLDNIMAYFLQVELIMRDLDEYLH